MIALAQAVRHIHAKRIALHREWMIRAFAIALAIATTRIIGVILITVSDDHSLEHLKLFFNASLTAALFLHTVVAEAWIRSTRSKVQWGDLRRSSRSDSRGSPAQAIPPESLP